MLLKLTHSRSFKRQVYKGDKWKISFDRETRILTKMRKLNTKKDTFSANLAKAVPMDAMKREIQINKVNMLKLHCFRKNPSLVIQ